MKRAVEVRVSCDVASAKKSKRRSFTVAGSEARRQADHAEGASGNVVNLMEALRRSVGKEAAPPKSTKKPRKAASGQKEILMPIEGRKAKEAPAKKPAVAS